MSTLTDAKALLMAIRRRVKGGGVGQAGRELLDPDMKRFCVKNLPLSLLHGGFAKPSFAERTAAVLYAD
jgi:hypothetical protein